MSGYTERAQYIILFAIYNSLDHLLMSKMILYIRICPVPYFWKNI